MSKNWKRWWIGVAIYLVIGIFHSVYVLKHPHNLEGGALYNFAGGMVIFWPVADIYVIALLVVP